MRAATLGAWVLLTAALVVAAPRPAVADLHGVPVPRGSRADPDDPGRLRSGKGYRDSVDHVRRWLDRQGLAHRRVGPYRVRGVDVTRFVSEAPGTAWLAIHVYRLAGTTWISVIPRPS